MSISAKEIANKLNISAATVSMVLNNKPGISDKTKNKVMEAAKIFGYDFSKKQELATGVIHFVIYKKHGNVVSETPFFSKVTEGIDSMCRENGYQLQISYFHETRNTNDQLKVIVESGCLGIILLGTEMTSKDFIPFSELSIPLIVLDSYFEEIDCDSVLINNIQGAYIATKYLIERGHKKIGYLRSNNIIVNFEERADGYFKALRNADIPTNHPYTFSLTPTLEGAYRDFKEYLVANPELPTAFFADNDIIAAASIRALKEHGLKIPENISIVGFDDTPVCEVLDPPLTTMYVPKHTLGALAVERLISIMNNSSGDKIKIEIATKLIERSSVR